MLQLSLSTILTSPTTPGAGFVPALSGDFSTALAGIAEAAASPVARTAVPAMPRQTDAEPGKSLPIAGAADAIPEANLIWPDHAATPTAPETDASTSDALALIPAAPAAGSSAAVQPSGAAIEQAIMTSGGEAPKSAGNPVAAQIILVADRKPLPAAVAKAVAGAPASPVLPDAAPQGVAPRATIDIAAPSSPLPMAKQQVVTSAAPDATAVEAPQETVVVAAAGAVASKIDAVSPKGDDAKKRADATGRHSEERPVEAVRQSAPSVVPIVVAPIMPSPISAPILVRTEAVRSVRPIVAGAISTDAPTITISPRAAHPADPGFSSAAARPSNTQHVELADAAAVKAASGAAVRPNASIADAPRASDTAAQPTPKAPPPPAGAAIAGGAPTPATAAAPGRPIAASPMPAPAQPISPTIGPVTPAVRADAATIAVAVPALSTPIASNPQAGSTEISQSVTRLTADGATKPDIPATPVVNAPARPAPVPQPAQPAAIVLGVAFGGIAPGQRPLGDTRPSPREQALQALTALAGAGPTAPIAATAQTQHGALDMRRDDWPQAMIDRIEALRDAADATSTRITLAPDALGKVDLSIRHDGGAVHVHFAAEAAQTRAILADAQPKLAELAQQRGFRLGQATVDAGASGGGQRQPPNAAPAPQRPTSAFATTPADADAADSTRLA